MKDALISLQTLYDIAMSIGTSLDMDSMLKKSLSTYMRKLSCTAGAVFQGIVVDDSVHLEPIYAIPRILEDNAIIQAAMAQIPAQIPMVGVDNYLEKLPYTGTHEGLQFHIMEVPDFGLLLLQKEGEPIDPHLMKRMEPVNAKLAKACQSCLRKKRIRSIAKDLKRENMVRRKVERALASSHEQLESIFDSLSAIVYVADLNTNEIIFNNRYMIDVFGDGLIGRPCYQVIRGEPDMCHNCGADTLVDDQGEAIDTVVWEECNPKLDRWFMHHSRAIPWRDGRLVRLQISTDITRLKQLEKDRVDAAHFEQAQRLKSLGNLAGGIAHEFNNLLMGMMGSLSLMKFDMKESHPFHLNLDRIEANIHEAAKLNDKLLGYAQKGRYEKRPIQVNSVIRGLVKPLSKTQAAIRIQMDLDENLHLIEVDGRQIEHALLSLLTNACEAMPDGGDLLICTANISAHDLPAGSDLPDVDGYVRINVEDNGIGMTPEIRDQIFDPFFTTKKNSRGAGLGMAATYGIFKGHGGFIEVDSTEGKGSQLVAYLPAATAADPLNDDNETSQKQDPSASKTILVADDEPAVLEIGEQMLAHLGHTVMTAENGMEAIATFQQHHQAIDLIILDVIMPKMAITETYEKLKAIDPEARILISSGYSLDSDIRKVLINGTDDFLQKPFSLEELASKINKALGISPD